MGKRPSIFCVLLALSAIFTLNGDSASSSTTLGVTYDPSAPNLPPPEQVVKTLRRLRIQAVQIINPTPSAIQAFSYTKISLLLSVPNPLIPSFAANRSNASLWVSHYVVPFYPRSLISAISVGSDVISSSPSRNISISTTLVPAIRNVHDSLQELGMKTISVSTSFAFINIMEVQFPPSSAEFVQPIFGTVIKPLLQFLQETNSSFMVKIYPYKFYSLRTEVTIGYVMFKDDIPFNYRDDALTRLRYRNLFDMMVDGVISALAMTGHDNIPVIVTETGWPSSGGSGGDNSTLLEEPDATLNYAEMYLVGLISHLKSGLGTPLRKEGLAGVYIYNLFDEDDNDTASAAMDNVTRPPGGRWGILYPNMTMKYKIDDFSISAAGNGTGTGGVLMTSPVVLLVVAILLLL